MNARYHWIFGLAGLGLAIAAPVQAAPNFMDDVIIVAKRDRGEEVYPDQRDVRKEDRRAPKREAEREEPHGYGYGYERRQQQRSEDQDRQRGRR